MDVVEFMYWTAYDCLYGIPDANIHAAEICAAATRPHTKRQITKMNFLPEAYNVPRKAQTAKEQHAMFRALTAHLRKPAQEHV